MMHAGRGARPLSALAVGAVITLGLAACSSGGGAKSAGTTGGHVTSTQAPQQAVSSAIAKVGAQSSARFTLSVPITQAQAERLKDGSGKGLTPAQAKALSTGTIFFAVATGRGEALNSTGALTDQRNSYDLGLSIGSDTPIELRYISQNVYLKADVAQLLTDVGQPASDAKKYTSALSQLDPYVSGLSALGQGKWVEVSQASLQPLIADLKQMGGGSGAAAHPGQLQSGLLQLRTQLLAALAANSTTSSLGSGQYRVTVNVSGLLDTVLPDIQSALSSIPGLGSQASSALAKAKDAIPARQSAVVDLTVSNGMLTQADLNLNQFAPQNLSVPVTLQLAISTPSVPAPPSGSTPLDLSGLPGLLHGLIGSLGGSSSSHSSSPTSAFLGA
jgi:hypothetical protein